MNCIDYIQVYIKRNVLFFMQYLFFINGYGNKIYWEVVILFIIRNVDGKIFVGIVIYMYNLYVYVYRMFY